MNLYQRIKNAGAALVGREVKRTSVSGGYSAFDLGQLLGQSGTVVDWAREAYPYYNNPIVAICAAKLASMIGEAELQLQMWDAKAAKWVESDHIASKAVAEIFRTPNDFETWSQIERAMVLSYSVFGESYLYVRRNAFNVPIGFTWVSPFEIKPMADRDNEGGTKAYTYFEHLLKGGDSSRTIPVEDVVFLRKGINPEDTKRGYSEVLQTVREIALYNDAATRHGAMVRNPGTGNLIFPKTPKDGIQPTPDQVEKGAKLINSLVMDRAGKSAMVPFEVGLEKLGLKPSDLDLSGIRQSAIDIICPAFGGDPMAFGLPSSSKKYDNLAAALDDLGKQTVLPMLSDWADAFSRLLIPALNLDTQNYRIAYDTTNVSWLIDELDQEQERHRENFKVGGMSLESFKLKIGEKPEKGDSSRNYFSIQQPEIQATQVNSCSCGGVSDWAKSLVQRNAELRRLRGKVQLNAMPKVLDNGKQSAHDKRIKQAKDTLTSLTESLLDSKIDADTFREKFSEELFDLHADMYVLGRQISGSPVTRSEAETVARQIVDLEQSFLSGFTNDLTSGDITAMTAGVTARVGLYAGKGSSTASSGFVDGSNGDEEFYWDLNGAVEDHCQDCPYLEANSPYFKDTLYAIPRNGSTPCLANCKCRLVRASDGLSAFGPF